MVSDNRHTTGLHAHRLNEHNPREVAFAHQWDKEHCWHDILQSLCSQECGPDDEGAVRVLDPICNHKRFPLGNVTGRDRIVAATVIQWLGSNVGMCFLEDALRQCSYRVERAAAAGGE